MIVLVGYYSLCNLHLNTETVHVFSEFQQGSRQVMALFQGFKSLVEHLVILRMVTACRQNALLQPILVVEILP